MYIAAISMARPTINDPAIAQGYLAVLEVGGRELTA
jgi:hypothetical protein